jgi:hypothetical protein
LQKAKGLRKDGDMKTSKLIIGIIVTMAATLISSDYVRGGDTITAKGAVEQSVVKFKCDPCDYNIDYGSQDSPAAKGKVDEGFIEIKCDPCDYNIDYGSQARSEK